MGFLKKTDELFRMLGGDAKGGAAKPAARPAAGEPAAGVPSSGTPAASTPIGPLSASVATATATLAAPASSPVSAIAPASAVAPAAAVARPNSPGVRAAATPSSPAIAVVPYAPAHPAPGTRPTGPTVRVAPSAAPHASGMFNALLPPGAAAAKPGGGAPAGASATNPGHAHAHAPATAPAIPIPAGLPAALSVAPLLEDDAPILVVEDFPADGAAAIFDDAPKPFLSRTLALRYDTATVGGFLGAIAIAVAFLLGRASVGQDPARAATAANDPPPLASDASRDPVLASTGPIAPPATPPPLPLARESSTVTPRLSLATDLAEESASSAVSPASPASERREAPPQPASAAQPRDALWAIAVVQKGNKDSCEDLKKYLEAKGFPASLERSGERYNVYVGGYADRGAPDALRDLAAVQELAPFKGVNFRNAQFKALRRSGPQ